MGGEESTTPWAEKSGLLWVVVVVVVVVPMNDGQVKLSQVKSSDSGAKHAERAEHAHH